MMACAFLSLLCHNAISAGVEKATGGSSAWRFSKSSSVRMFRIQILQKSQFELSNISILMDEFSAPMSYEKRKER